MFSLVALLIAALIVREDRKEWDQFRGFVKKEKIAERERSFFDVAAFVKIQGKENFALSISS